MSLLDTPGIFGRLRRICTDSVKAKDDELVAQSNVDGCDSDLLLRQQWCQDEGILFPS